MPQPFDHWRMLGHDWAVDLLHRQVARDQIRHAYLICGAPGVGRRTLALRFVQALNCPQPIADGIPCGVCLDCKKIENQKYPDLVIIEPTIRNPNNNKELIRAPHGEIRIEQVRDLRKSFYLKPYQGKFRVALFLNFEKANENAANALLKTLEEAPTHAILILTADTPERIMPTIVSRCEVLRLRTLPVNLIEEDLVTTGLEHQRARLLAHLSGGRPGIAYNFLSNQDVLEEREELLNDLQSLLSSSRVQKFSYADKLSKDKDAMRQAILVWISYWRDVMLRATKANLPLVNIDRAIEVDAWAGKLEFSKICGIINSLEGALDRLDKNVNARLLAEVLLLDLPGG